MPERIPDQPTPVDTLDKERKTRLYAAAAELVSPERRALFDRLAALPDLDFDMKRLMHEGPDEILTRTEFTQPCLAAFQAASHLDGAR